MTNETTHLPIARIYPNQIVIYSTPIVSFNRTFKQIENEKNLTRGEYNGYMSPKTKGKVKKYLISWIQSVTAIRQSPMRTKLDKIPYLTFVTLTLPTKQAHHDNKIKRTCLMPFIENLKRLHKVENYFWRAEAQKNGNIHFHLLIDSYIHYKEVQDLWNTTIEKLDYITKFQAKHGHRNPHSTEIKKLKKINNVAMYVIKYCCKSDGTRPIKGRIHGCSDRLRKLAPYECLIDSNMRDFINYAQNDEESKILEGDCYTVILCNTNRLLANNYRRISELIKLNYITMAMELYTIPREEKPPPQPSININNFKIPKYKQLALDY